MIRLLQAGGFYAMVSLVENKADIAKTLRAWNVRGAVFLGMFDDEIEQIYAASKAPMVFVDSYSNMRRICSVGIDDYRGGRLAARCLAEHGHTRLAFAGPAQHATGVIQQRLAGFMDELAARGLTLEPEHRIVVESDSDPARNLRCDRCAVRHGWKHNGRLCNKRSTRHGADGRAGRARVFHSP